MGKILLFDEMRDGVGNVTIKIEKGERSKESGDWQMAIIINEERIIFPSYIYYFCPAFYDEYLRYMNKNIQDGQISY